MIKKITKSNIYRAESLEKALELVTELLTTKTKEAEILKEAIPILTSNAVSAKNQLNSTNDLIEELKNLESVIKAKLAINDIDELLSEAKNTTIPLTGTEAAEQSYTDKLHITGLVSSAWAKLLFNISNIQAYINSNDKLKELNCLNENFYNEDDDDEVPSKKKKKASVDEEDDDDDDDDAY